MGWLWYWLKQQIDWERAGQAAAVLALLLFGFFACTRMVDTGSDIVRDLPPRTTLSPSQVREQEEAKRIVEETCALWWDDLVDLPDHQAQVCVDGGYGR